MRRWPTAPSVFSARAERDYLVISVSTLKENAPEAMHLLQLALTHPRFDAEAVTRVRAQIIQSLQQDEAEPPAWRSRAFMRDFFGGHAYAHPVDGEIDSISVDHGGGSAQFRAQPLDQRRPQDRGGGRHHRAGAAPSCWARPSSRCRARCRRRCPMSGRLGAPGVHVVAAAGAAAHRHVRPAGHHARTIRISFPAMSPITFWAAAAFPRA